MSYMLLVTVSLISCGTKGFNKEGFVKIKNHLRDFLFSKGLYVESIKELHDVVCDFVRRINDMPDIIREDNLKEDIARATQIYAEIFEYQECYCYVGNRYVLTQSLLLLISQV